VADSKQFGTPRTFGDKAAGNPSGDSGHCARCEAMLADAVDGTLSAADQEFFDLHMAVCASCSQQLADARRGAAWLEMLRTPAPEPPATLVERILTQTSWAQEAAEAAASLGMQPSDLPLSHPQHAVPAMAAGYAGPAGQGVVIPFPRRFMAAVRTSSFGQIMRQPRLAMTAAMAFFSIALTMNLAGIHPLSLRASDLQPSSLKREYHDANARVIRYYEGLRVVYELESRVHDLQTATDNDATAGNPPAAGQPARPASSPQPAPADQKAAPQPSGNQPSGSQPQHAKPAPGPGSSRREDPIQSRRLFVAETTDDRDGLSQARVVGRTRV
jgi:hypothetical protein